MTYLFTDINGNVSRAVPGGLAQQTVPKPTGVTPYYPLSRPSFARYALINGTRPYYLTFINGQFNEQLTWTPGMALYKSGIEAPTAALGCAVTGSGSLTGAVLASFTWAQYENGILVQQGNPSPKTAEVTFTADQVAISSIPSTAPDARTTHWIVYLSVDGSLSYKAAVYPLGATAATFNISNAALFENETLPIFLDSQGNPQDDVLARGLPPYATVIGLWHQRMWYVVPGSAGVFYSALNEPESVNEDTDRGYIPTLGGEYPLSLGIMDDELVVFTEEVFYSIAGFGETSFSMRKISDGIRFICPMSPITTQGMVMFASDQGVMAYFGGGGNGFRALMARSLRNYWIADLAANVDAYQNAVATDDRVYGEYVLALDKDTTFHYRGYYRPMVEDGEHEPWWHWDVRTRRDRTVGQLFYPNSRRGLIAYGECDGKARFDDAADADDDSDSLRKQYRVMTKHFYMGSQAGDDAHAKTFTNGNWFGLQGGVDLTVNTYAGDDSANEGTPTETLTLAPLPDQQGQTTEATSRSLVFDATSGQGVTIETVALAPLAVEFRGPALEWRKGSNTRS
jgi:hypothetical protein